MKNVIFAGVGGQGVILASKILMEVAMNAGYDVKESEVHGMPSGAAASTATCGTATRSTPRSSPAKRRILS